MLISGLRGATLIAASVLFGAMPATAQTQAPPGFGATSGLALDVARQFGRTLTTRIDLGSPRDGDLLSGARVFAVGDSVTRKVGASAISAQSRSSSVGATIGIEAGFGGGTAGIAANYSKSRNRFGSDPAGTDCDSYQLGAFAAFGLAGAFAQAYLGYGRDRHRIARTATSQRLSARPRGAHLLGGVKAGYLMPLAGLRAGPALALDYAWAKVGGYREKGDAALTLAVRSRRAASLRGSAGIELRGDFGTASAPFRPFATLVAEKELAGGGGTILYVQGDAPTIVQRVAVASESQKSHARGTAGLAAGIGGGISIDTAISATFGKARGNETSGQLALNLAI